uniref:Cytoplasmic dynein 2 light intermediate chain 1 n=1 Tax=Palpitomonas bilix TaxID=652834 RepID=A0A7S3GCS5_9EUKA|mmetsp:Transcript_43758/g.114119  ORF Transcript_43758/g.114119 Transcript_43758/m.114119 type:complete len:402 (+) Transcript_43758:156-1361(+)|eukprot:CAMPEP_0113883432 /NCGR_PEP_ID=MMETSP0780_2-20120614/9597_1 /TAXON_ID=652834 /ORGANISM="Palpitomonas bilix" /LENGTH=401 /DNA_ID=CAMNT_0000870737 /DNA_START=122 /DNA_END=1327 /DNA_ORIENTATION=+ /assembly_acc=CAM_ASM_000599
MAAPGGEGGRAAGMDIWSSILAEKGQDLRASERRHHTVLVVGPKGSGKSSLISRIIKPDKVDKEESKEATGLEYTYMRGRTGQSLEDTVVHLWELGGGKKMEQLVDVVITPHTIANAVVVVMLDLSKPSVIFNDILYWMQRIKRRTEECFKELRLGRTTKKVPDETKERSKKRFANHPDVSAVSFPAIPIIFVGSKYDTFQDRDMETQKIMAKCLRFVAHSHGCSICYYTIKDSTTVKKFRALSNSFVFRTNPGTGNLEHVKPLYVPAGSDALSKIGFPSIPGGAGNFHGDPQDLWKMVFEKTFPDNPADLDLDEIDTINVEDFAEPTIDSMAMQKIDEIARYRLEVERREKEEEELRQRLEKGGLSSLTAGGDGDDGKIKKAGRGRAKRPTHGRAKRKGA